MTLHLSLISSVTDFQTSKLPPNIWKIYGKDFFFSVSQTAADGWQIQHFDFDSAKIVSFTFMETAWFFHEVSMQDYFFKGSGYVSNVL